MIEGSISEFLGFSEEEIFASLLEEAMEQNLINASQLTEVLRLNAEESRIAAQDLVVA